MDGPQPRHPLEIPALKVHQWLNEWNKVDFKAQAHQRKPDPHFYMFTLRAGDLKALSGIRRRTTEGGQPRAQDLGNQRRHEPGRSKEIRQFVKYGYPWSDFTEAKRESGRFNDLRKPGWLPTAILLNILKPEDTRNAQEVFEKETVTVRDIDDRNAVIRLPEGFDTPDWRPRVAPFEIIDGQHRLWAFEEDDADITADYELPVVAFHGLDISWQAYLFWTINIKPKRINASLAFDMYPLLRTEDWFERFEGHSIYRETRAQELTEALWSHGDSPWRRRINMLGDPGKNMVTQASWIRSLLATYVKASEGRRVSIGGLFGAPVGSDEEALPWSRSQQAAFLIFVWRKIRDAIRDTKLDWATALRPEEPQEPMENGDDPAFAGPYTLLNTDQGVRGVLYVTNDLCFVMADKLKLRDWANPDASATDEDAVSSALDSFNGEDELKAFLSEVAESLAKYDWRTASAPGLSEYDHSQKLVFRGSGGYRELRRQLLRHLAGQKEPISGPAKTVLKALGYD